MFTLVLTHLAIFFLIIGVAKRPSYPREFREVPLLLSKKHISRGETRFGDTIGDVDLTALVFVVQRWFIYRWNGLEAEHYRGQISPDLV